jgi:hypothetical protein
MRLTRDGTIRPSKIELATDHKSSTSLDRCRPGPDEIRQRNQGSTIIAIPSSLRSDLSLNQAFSALGFPQAEDTTVRAVGNDGSQSSAHWSWPSWIEAGVPNQVRREGRNKPIGSLDKLCGLSGLPSRYLSPRAQRRNELIVNMDKICRLHGCEAEWPEVRASRRNELSRPTKRTHVGISFGIVDGTRFPRTGPEEEPPRGSGPGRVVSRHPPGLRGSGPLAAPPGPFRPPRERRRYRRSSR